MSIYLSAHKGQPGSSCGVLMAEEYVWGLTKITLCKDFVSWDILRYPEQLVLDRNPSKNVRLGDGMCLLSDRQDSMSRASTACWHQHHQSIWKKSLATSQCRRTFGCPEFSVGCSRGHQLQAVWPNVSAAGEWTGPCRDCSTSPRSRCEDLGSLEVHGNHKAWQIGKYKHRITVYIYIYMIIYDLYALDNESQVFVSTFGCCLLLQGFLFVLILPTGLGLFSPLL